MRYPFQQADENVGGGRGNNYTEHTTDMLITIDEDRRLNNLKKQRDVIDDCLDDSGNDTEVIIKELYFKKRPDFTVDGLIVKGLIHTSRSKAFELRSEFFNNVARGLGMYEPKSVD